MILGKLASGSRNFDKLQNKNRPKLLKKKKIFGQGHTFPVLASTSECSLKWIYGKFLV